MFKMLTSASRMVLIIVTVTVCVGFLTHVLDAKDFMMLAGMVFAFYFTKTDGGKNQDYSA